MKFQDLKSSFRAVLNNKSLLFWRFLTKLDTLIFLKFAKFPESRIFENEKREKDDFVDVPPIITTFKLDFIDLH